MIAAEVNEWRVSASRISDSGAPCLLASMNRTVCGLGRELRYSMVRSMRLRLGTSRLEVVKTILPNLFQGRTVFGRCTPKIGSLRIHPLHEHRYTDAGGVHRR